MAHLKFKPALGKNKVGEVEGKNEVWNFQSLLVYEFFNKSHLKGKSPTSDKISNIEFSQCPMFQTTLSNLILIFIWPNVPITSFDSSLMRQKILHKTARFLDFSGFEQVKPWRKQVFSSLYQSENFWSFRN